MSLSDNYTSEPKEKIFSIISYLFKSFSADQLRLINNHPLTDIKDDEVTKLKEYYKFKKDSDELLLCYIIGKDKVLLNDKDSQWNKYQDVFSDIIEKIDELGPIEVIENIINKTLRLLKGYSSNISRKPKENTGMTDLLFNDIQRIYDEFDESMKDPIYKLNRFKGMDKYFEEYSSFYTEMKDLKALSMIRDEKKRQRQMNYNKIKRELANIKSEFVNDFEEDGNIEGIDDETYDVLKDIRKSKGLNIDYNEIEDKEARLYLECSHFLYALEVSNTASAIVQYYELLRELEISKDKLINDFENFEVMKESLEIYVTARINYYAKNGSFNHYYIKIRRGLFGICRNITQEQLDSAINTLLENDWIKPKIKNDNGNMICDVSHVTDKCCVDYEEDEE